jgi:hypothetical protein
MIPMLRKFAVAMIATTMLVAPALAADPVKPSTAAPAASTSTTTTPSAAKTDTAGQPANANKTDKAGKTDGTSKPDVKGSKTDKNVAPGTAPAADVKTVKADKDLKSVKVAARPHRHHSHHWYMVHRGKHPSHTLTATVSKPVKHVGVRKPHKESVHEVKTNKTLSNKGGSSS